MEILFAIIDDDISIRKILRRIISEENLGTVIAECGDGLEAEEILQNSQANIVLIDMLLPGQDGVELIKRIKSKDPALSFIMISQVKNEPMITSAYESGIEFFIHKPINVLEVISVIKKVKESRQLRQFMSLIKQTTSKYAESAQPMKEEVKGLNRTAIYRIFSDLGIIGEAGVKDIYFMMEHIGTNAGDTYQLSDVYGSLSHRLSQDAKAIEQRVRRTIAKALQNLANLGIDDYYNDKFQTYSTALFDFKEVRQEMNLINNKSTYHGKINVKKFIEGILFASEQSS